MSFRTAAFLTVTPVPLHTPLAPPSLCARRATKMCEPATRSAQQQPSAAELTRQKLSESEPLVKFRRQTEYLDRDTSFTYTRGVTKGSVDIWLITGVLTFLVPLLGFAIGVATGNIDVNPR